MRTKLITAMLVGAMTTAAAAPDVQVHGVGYEIQASSPEVRVGASGAVTLELRAADGRKINDDYPIKIAVAASDGVAVAKTTLEGTDAVAHDERHAAFAIGVAGKSAGERRLDLDIRFAVCSSVACELQHRTVAVPITVR